MVPVFLQSSVSLVFFSILGDLLYLCPGEDVGMGLWGGGGLLLEAGSRFRSNSIGFNGKNV